MNIIHLKYVIEIAEKGSMSKAAEHLYIAQPNLSRAIKDLENELNITIFERNSKGTILTPDGEKLILYGKKILKQIEELEYEFDEKSKKNIFSLSAPRSSYISYAFTNFSQIISKMKNTEFIYKETNAYKTINNVTSSDFKLGIIRYNIIYDNYFKKMLIKKDLDCELIHEFNYVLVFSKDSLLASKEGITTKDLEKYIEISHMDLYVPQIPMTEVTKMELTKKVTKRIFVFERASQFELLSENKETFMWVSPIPERTLNRYGLVQKKCVDKICLYKDLLIYKKTHKFTKLERDFITYLCESKRDVEKNN